MKTWEVKDYLSLEEMSETQILQMLHRKKMALIEAQFQKRGKGLNIEEFLAVMLEHLDYDHENKALKMQITLALIDFFKEVDVNGDETMEWDEFSNHIIELGLVRDDRNFKNVIKSYFPSDKIADKEKHETGIESIYYFEKLRSLFLIEQDSSRFKVYNAVNSSLLYEVNAQKGSILDLEYLEQQNLIATSSNDLTINFWDASSFTLKQIVSVPEIQLRVRYADWRHADKQLLYTGGSDAIVHIYDATTLKERGTISGWNPYFKSDQQQEGHLSPIGDMLAVDKQQTLVTACLGGKICLWDAGSHRLKKELRGHDKGVYSLDWCGWSQMNNCLLSAGLDHEAFVWNTYVRDKIFLLRGHNHPLVGVRWLPDTPQIITADTQGMVKVWDVRNFLCVQTFNAPVDALSSFCLAFARDQAVKRRILCCAKKMHCFEYDEPRDQLLTDEKPCLKVLFDLTLLCFVTMHSDCLKVWDCRSGHLLSVYRGLCAPHAQLTAMVLDNRERKLFVGDSDGHIFTVNIKNGARMKDFQRHEAAVTALEFWSSAESQQQDDRHSDLRRIVSTSMGSEVYVHDEDAPEDAKSSCRYIMKQHKDSVLSVAIRRGTEILATGSTDGHVILTNLVSYRHEVLPRNSEAEIRHVLFLDPFECLLSIDVEGRLTFYGVGDNKFKSKIIFEKQYETESMTKTKEGFPISSVKFAAEEQVLILGDEFGNVELWSVEKIVEVLTLNRIEKGFLSRRKDKLRNNSSVLLTEIRVEDSFQEDMVQSRLKMKAAHSDGVTAIELIREKEAFVTASFDCCCYVWRLVDGVKLGALVIGTDPAWTLHFDMTTRREAAVKEAVDLLDSISKKKNYLYDQSEIHDEESLRRYEIMKNHVLKGAKELIENQKKTQRPETIIDILGHVNKLEKDFFDDQENSFNLTSELDPIKFSSLISTIKR